MAKIIKYQLCNRINRGTEEEPLWEDVLYPVEMGWNEVNEEIAKKESYNGEYTIEDDGQPEPEIPTEDDVWADMAAALQEGVDSV